MFARVIVKKTVAALAIGGGLALTQLSAPGAVTAGAVLAPVSEYPASVVTDTEVSLEKSTVAPGESNTAYASVSADAGTPQGRVTFKVSGHQKESVPLVDGEASYEMPTDLRAGRTYRVMARYNGKAVYRPSHDATHVTVTEDGQVAGEEGERSDSGGSANRPATGGDVLGEQTGVLPNVGSDAATTVVALGGLGLLAAGAAALVMRRRRHVAG